ncbi:MAG: circularly permuted type 2 ATP-grasp protein [Terrimicrobiaceae bacterium]
MYRPLFERLDSMPLTKMRSLDEQLEATMREMGVTFDIARDRPWGRRPWFCDLLPQIFTPQEWEPLVAGVKQRLRAFEMFLQDVYSKKQILREEEMPIQPVLGSSMFRHAAANLPPPGGAYLHLSGLSVCRMPNGELAVKHHYFSNASGMSYMIQNRRALARVIPQSFQETSIHSIADAPTDILEMLRSLSGVMEPTVVLLSPGPGSPVYSEHSFLARRMGIPLVQGGDLLVLNDAVFLKTVSGLQKVEIIYSRISDEWLDPMAFRRDSVLGVPGLVHCIRKGTVAVVNGIGSQLADDRSLLPLAGNIIRYYLGERPILKTLPTYWLGDIDQREMVLADLADYTIRPLYGEKIFLGGDGRTPSAEKLESVRNEILQNASHFVAQPQACDAETVCFQDGKSAGRRQDHIIFALRRSNGDYEVFPGALTRVSTHESPFTSSELGGGSKDTWVQVGFEPEQRIVETPRAVEPALPSQRVTSRVAGAFYWIGRYMERAYNLAGMVGVIESLELEELNPTERTLYRPVWNRILPMLEGSGTATRRTISNATGRYRLTLDIEEPGSVVSAILRASRNAEDVLETMSLEAWGVLSLLRDRFQKTRFRPDAPSDILTSSSRKLCDFARALIPQFFGTAECTMVADGGWKFCEIGQLIERAAITANAITSISGPLLQAPESGQGEHAMEIRLSAFLRLLNSRDIYRRVYQMRIEPAPLLELLWNNPVAPRSVARCLRGCATRIAESEDVSSPATGRSVAAIETLICEINATDWDRLLFATGENPRKSPLQARSEELLARVRGIHDLVSDGFLNHQIHMRHETQSLFPNT